MISTPYSWASRVKVMNCLGVSTVACCRPGIVPGVRSFMASVAEASVKSGGHGRGVDGRGKPFRPSIECGWLSEAADIQDQGHASIAQDGGAADAVNRA